MHTSTISFLFTLLLPLLSFADNSHSETSVGRRASHRQRSAVSRLLESRDRATFYEAGHGACGGYNSDADFIIALNSGQFGTGGNCYKMITINANGKSTQAQIVDECPGCPYGGVDMSPSLFQFFGPLSLGVLDVTWSFADAAPAPAPSPAPTPTYTPPTSSVWTPTPTPTTASTSKLASSSTSSSSSWSSSTSSSSTPTSSSPVPTPTPSPPSPNNLDDISALVISLGQIVLGSVTN